MEAIVGLLRGGYNLIIGGFRITPLWYGVTSLIYPVQPFRCWRIQSDALHYESITELSCDNIEFC